jgi:hypothetical protein
LCNIDRAVPCASEPVQIQTGPQASFSDHSVDISGSWTVTPPFKAELLPILPSVTYYFFLNRTPTLNLMKMTHNMIITMIMLNENNLIIITNRNMDRMLMGGHYLFTFVVGAKNIDRERANIRPVLPLPRLDFMIMKHIITRMIMLDNIQGTVTDMMSMKSMVVKAHARHPIIQKRDCLHVFVEKRTVEGRPTKFIGDA